MKFLDYIEQIPNITIAKRIVDYRSENGKFNSIEELKNVSGIGESKYKQIMDKITI